MKEQRASAAALATSLIRAVHARCDCHPILHDTFGDQLLTAADRSAWLERFRLMLNPEQQALVASCTDIAAALDNAVRASPPYGAVIIRHRYAEDLLASAIARGVTQYVILGAGLDSFAFRHPELTERLRILEIDQAATQAMKRERLAAAGIAQPPNLTYVAADLEEPGLGEALAAAGLRVTEPAFVTLLGVTQYLSRDASLSVLRRLAMAMHGGSEVVFDYLDPEALSPSGAGTPTQRVAAERATSAEPWVGGLDAACLAQDLASSGWQLVEDLDAVALEQRYCAKRTDGLSVTSHVHVAAARISE